MNVIKQNLGVMERCYTVSMAEIDHKPYILFASDGRQGQLVGYYGVDFKEQEIILPSLNGCMVIKQVPNRENELLVIADFYLGDSPSQAKILWLRKVNGSWLKKELASLPFIHRLDVTTVDDKTFVIAATIADFKKDKEDWRYAGSLYAGELPEEFNGDEPLNLKRIYQGLHENHGYFHYHDQEVYFSGREGVFRLELLSPEISHWSITQIASEPTSDLLYGDFDDDGEAELLIITPFHGDTLKLLKADETGFYRESVWEYRENTEIIHGLASFTMNNKPYFAVGVRKAAAELLLFYFQGGVIEKIVLDEGHGPMNLNYLPAVQGLAVANHTGNHGAIYYLKGD